MGFAGYCLQQLMEISLRRMIIASALVASALAVAAAPVAEARQRVLVCKSARQVRHAANTGTVVGAVGGGLLGNVVSSGGGKTGGTLIGAGVGAVAGHQIAKSNARKKCHYEWR
jgi:uncharacterized protein YcfJ